MRHRLKWFNHLRAHGGLDMEISTPPTNGQTGQKDNAVVVYPVGSRRHKNHIKQSVGHCQSKLTSRV